MFWMEDGEILQKLDDKEYSLNRGDIFISSPDRFMRTMLKISTQKLKVVQFYFLPNILINLGRIMIFLN
ncbi:hypothetical protein [Chryseobacterium wanjuense]